MVVYLSEDQEDYYKSVFSDIAAPTYSVTVLN